MFLLCFRKFKTKAIIISSFRSTLKGHSTSSYFTSHPAKSLWRFPTSFKVRLDKTFLLVLFLFIFFDKSTYDWDNWWTTDSLCLPLAKNGPTVFLLETTLSSKTTLPPSHLILSRSSSKKLNSRIYCAGYLVTTNNLH